MSREKMADGKKGFFEKISLTAPIPDLNFCRRGDINITQATQDNENR
jgi:hypothetical protein